MIPLSHQLSIKLMQRCPSCGQGISSARIRVIRETDRSLFAHVHCEACAMNFLTHISVYPQGLTGNSVMTDLDYDEAVSLFAKEPLDENIFLDLYKVIENSTLLSLVRSREPHGEHQ